MKNRMELIFRAISENEALARMTISAFLIQSNPTMSLISEVRTAVSEAVTNAIVHAYGEKNQGDVMMRAILDSERLIIEIEDHGCGIADIDQAMKPFYTSQPEKERSGMGFSLMQSFMDGITVESQPEKGTRITMTKMLSYDETDIF